MQGDWGSKNNDTPSGGSGRQPGSSAQEQPGTASPPDWTRDRHFNVYESDATASAADPDAERRHRWMGDHTSTQHYVGRNHDGLRRIPAAAMVIPALFLVSCPMQKAAQPVSAASYVNDYGQFESPAEQLGAHAVILSVSQVDRILAQCSRRTPKVDGKPWMPTAAEVATLEAGLVSLLNQETNLGGIAGDMAAQMRTPAEERAIMERRLTITRMLDRTNRQYVGITRKGEQFIYGNFFPDAGTDLGWIQQAITSCARSDNHFGVEFHPKTGSFTALDFNGNK